MGHATEETGAHAVERPECPRCGYDQSGEMATWREACPLYGRCVECGLEVEWREVVSPRYSVPRWFVEAEGRRWWSGEVTGALALVPEVFWRKVRLTYPFRARRAVRAVAWGALLGMVLPGVVAGAARWWGVSRGVHGAAFSWWDWLGPLRGGEVLGLEYWGPGYGWTWSSDWTFREGVLGVPLPTGADAASAALLGVLFPLGFLLLPVTLRRLRVRRRHLARVAIYGVGGMAAAMSLPWAADVLLGHLAAVASQLWVPWWRVEDWWWERRELEWATAAAWAWLVVWWWRAGALYLRMPRALLVALAMGVLALAGLALVMVGVSAVVMW